MQTAKFTLLVLFCGCLLAACGLRGPLYLPEDEPVARPDTDQNARTKEEEKEKEAEKDGGSEN